MFLRGQLSGVEVSRVNSYLFVHYREQLNTVIIISIMKYGYS